MTRVALLAVLSIAACGNAAPDAERRAEPRGPSLPTRIEAGTPECAGCEISSKRFGSDEPKWASTCALSQRYGCPGGGTCGTTIECDASCCETAPAKQATTAPAPR